MSKAQCIFRRSFFLIQLAIDEDWLMHGNGEPFEPDDDDILEEVFCHCNCSEFERAFLKEYLFLRHNEPPLGFILTEQVRIVNIFLELFAKTH